jgi:putative ABC transport system ATP-binding protein
MKKSKSIIEFRGVFLDFKTKTKTKEIFKDCNFTVKAGQKVVVFGKSGTGKSTLLNLILGFKQPKSGSIFFKNKKITPDNIWQVRQQIAYVDQDVMMGEGLVKEIIDEYFSFVANSKVKFSQKELEKCMHDFDLDVSLLDKDISHLSGGERQRLALVVALLLKRPVMILDEVTSALDPASKEMAIKKLLQNKENTLIVITHDKEWQNERGVKVFDFKEKIWVR